MRHPGSVCAALAVFVILAMPAVAGNGAPAGSHYTLNVIGVEKPKSSTMTNSNRRTIFVALGRTGKVTSRIYLTEGDWGVCDGNAFDTAWSCDGEVVSGQGAVFQLPAYVGDTSVYEIWARALGTPGGMAVATTCAVDSDGVEYCSSENVVLVRDRGKSTFKNVSRQLTSLVVDVDGDGVSERIELFRDDLEDWSWSWDNNGLKLAQLRFYAVKDIKR